MSNNLVRRRIHSRNVNSIFLVGEVVDVGYLPKRRGYNVRARLRINPNSGEKNQFIYVEVFGRRTCSEVMSVVCQIGNIVYVEGEFRNYYTSDNVAMSYVLVTHIECLLRRKDVVAPSTSIIKMLDALDPIGYVPNISRTYEREKKKKSNRNAPEKMEL